MSTGSVLVGKTATGSHARCQTCGYGTVQAINGVSPAMVVHAASCPERGDDRYVACDNRYCRKVLDPERVRVHGAKTCDDKCRGAAWKAKTGYGRPRRRANGRQKVSGLQLSYAKTERELIERLAHFPGGRRLIAEALRAALSERQRKQLEARQ
jgi:hypothetical protein